MAYSSTLGRWVQGDPKGYVDGANLYEYVKSSPTRYTDPFGTQATAPATQPTWKNYDGNAGVWSMASVPEKVDGRPALAVGVAFLASSDDKKCAPCKTIKLVQIIRFTYGVGDEIKHPPSLGTSKHPQLQTIADAANGIEAGWGIDFNGIRRNAQGKVEPLPAGKPVPRYYTDHFQSKSDSVGFKDNSQNPATGWARMSDRPDLSLRPGAKFEAETYAVCVETGVIMGGLSWSFTFNEALTAVPANPKVVEEPSKNFLAAEKLFDSYFSNTPRGK